MNLYFIVEGRRTEYKIYPAWLSHLLPQFDRVRDSVDAQRRHYYLAHGSGIPSLYRFVADAVEELNTSGQYNFLVVCIDAEESTAAEVIEDLMNDLAKRNLKPRGYELLVMVQNRCIETWLLGNRKVFQRNPADETLKQFLQHYDVSANDPEEMPSHETYDTHAAFHYDYLRLMLKERNIEYTKVFPRAVTDPDYLDQLILRTQETTHLPSLRQFLDFCDKVNP